ncbi:MAG: HD superfamily phosphohydrolase [Acidobacteria bacterium OLB17]|nr:MAG: HD superfamily phosphohydrolase [Acidobacteria bacterium OLB17]MCZ2390769.1 HD domain-containing protein [Acidobacteriota bacterium]
MQASDRGSERYYRDAVHNIIRVDARTAEGRLFADLIDTPEFQRLRRIRQLGLAYFAYQSAEHSRFTHSLGAFNLATRVMAKLSAIHPISDEERIAVRAAALLHDIGHGAFSHVIESILGFHHENYSVAAICEPRTDINRVLTAFSPTLSDDVAAIIKGTYRRRALAQLVSSQLDVDRMDYLLRDSLMTGAKYGVYDLEWIVKSIDIDEENDRIFVAAPGIAAVEDYLQARYYMFRQVYFHRTLRAAESVLKSLLHRAIAVYSEGGDVWHIAGSALENILQGRPLSLEMHLELDDTDVLFHIKQWRASADTILSDLSKRFIERKIFKAFDLDMDDADKAVFLDQARNIVEAHGFDPEYYLVEDSAKHADYYFYARDTHDVKNLIFVEHGYSRPKIREISEVSAAVRGLQEGYRAQRVCFPAELRSEIEALYRQ